MHARVVWWMPVYCDASCVLWCMPAYCDACPHIVMHARVWWCMPARVLAAHDIKYAAASVHAWVNPDRIAPLDVNPHSHCCIGYYSNCNNSTVNGIASNAKSSKQGLYFFSHTDWQKISLARLIANHPDDICIENYNSIGLEIFIVLELLEPEFSTKIRWMEVVLSNFECF